MYKHINLLNYSLSISWKRTCIFNVIPIMRFYYRSFWAFSLTVHHSNDAGVVKCVMSLLHKSSDIWEHSKTSSIRAGALFLFFLPVSLLHFALFCFFKHTEKPEPKTNGAENERVVVGESVADLCSAASAVNTVLISPCHALLFYFTPKNTNGCVCSSSLMPGQSDLHRFPAGLVGCFWEIGRAGNSFLQFVWENIQQGRHICGN